MVRYRLANEGDIPQMTAIRLGVRENRLSDPGWLTRAKWIDALSTSGNAATWVAERAGEVVGFATGRIAEADIWALFVDPRHEGQGIGRGLLARVATWMFGAGVGEIRLGTAEGTRADRFYRRNGWKRGERTDKGEVVYRLQCKVSPPAGSGPGQPTPEPGI
ncbi:Ribosomal protein S18 acetylase RimI [Dokdonella immobilis]|uniref:Ribosomal protein S18 acetylase RimI n=2 Tax=Dokdonella immobilis TaxID=578942 RepID=A0A1I4XDG1_9GAMM|nr:Ribosomal protein S18 acetylase RimI [Dokdonella immobilis]